jgi:hypothetical protein
MNYELLSLKHIILPTLNDLLSNINLKLLIEKKYHPNIIIYGNEGACDKKTIAYSFISEISNEAAAHFTVQLCQLIVDKKIAFERSLKHLYIDVAHYSEKMQVTVFDQLIKPALTCDSIYIIIDNIDSAENIHLQKIVLRTIEEYPSIHFMFLTCKYPKLIDALTSRCVAMRYRQTPVLPQISTNSDINHDAINVLIKTIRAIIDSKLLITIKNYNNLKYQIAQLSKHQHVVMRELIVQFADAYYNKDDDLETFVYGLISRNLLMQAPGGGLLKDCKRASKFLSRI